MDKHTRRARREVGLPKFERECRLTRELGRLKKAYKVPGTREAGIEANLYRRMGELSARYRAEAESH